MPIIAWLLKALTAGGLMRVLMWIFTAKGAAIVIRLMGTLGIAWFTYEQFADPLMDMVDGYVGGIPSSIREWLSALGVLEVMSIVVSAYTTAFFTRLFLGRRKP